MQKLKKIRRNRNLRSSLKFYFRNVFVWFQRYKVLLLPYHFYIQIPNISFLANEEFWRGPKDLKNINGIDVNNQLNNISNEVTSDFVASLPSLEIHSLACDENGDDGYAKIDSQYLYCFLNKYRPKKIVQVGCGVSTAIMLRASQDFNFKVEIICIEPYPSEFLIQAYIDGRITLIKEFAQKISMDFFLDLSEGDLLFIDSTHTVMVGSEVNRLILEVLPSLKKGVFVHFHDIWFPFDHSRILLTEDIYFWGETSLLHSFLLFNSKYEVHISLSYLHYYALNELKSLFLNYNAQSNSTGLMEPDDIGKDYPTACYLKVLY